MEAVAAMAMMRDAGAALGVVSNANGQIEGTIANLSICQVGPGGGIPVEIVVDSAVVGVEKPDPAIFGPAIEVMTAKGITTERIAYVGDSLLYDIGGARAAGLIPVLMDPLDLYGGMDLGPGAHRIASLHDLLPPPVRPEAHPGDLPEPEAT
jgi:putative hydrolase of the HAD superfamily